jgi:hypothetical protein
MDLRSPIPRPEYPRPDRQRGLVEGVDWLNLNGPWQFRFDAKGRGVEEQWFAPGGPEWRDQIIVPFCWESLAAWGEGDAAGNDNYYATRVYLDPVGVTRENYRSAPRYEIGWYRRQFAIPDTPPWRARRIVLTIGASDFFTTLWCNGVLVGEREGGYVPLEFDLTEALAQTDPKRALIVIRVEDPMDNSEQPVGKQWGWYTPTSGIWQTVFVEPRPAVHIDHYRAIPNIDAGSVQFEVHCCNSGPTTTLTAEIIPPEAPRFKVTLPIEDGVGQGAVELSPLTLWDPAAPKLYRVVFRLKHGGLEDVVRGYFGMRKIHAAPVPGGDEKSPAILHLNNKPIYLRGALYQSYFPDGVYTPRDAQTYRDDVAFARESGFDFLRVHIKLDDPLLLYHADTVGMLLMQDIPNFGEGGDTPTGRRRFEEMLIEGMQRDFNHPSIIAWCIFNETWGFGGQNELMKFIAPALSQKLTRAEMQQKIANSESFQWVHKVWQLAKALDPTRLIEDMSVVVWEHLAAYGHVDTDINSWHFYIDNYEKAKAHIENVVAQSYRGSAFNYVEGYQQKNAPLINSEYGGSGALDGDRDISWTFKFLTNELRRHGALSAYIFTQLTDVEWEYNGLLNYDRTRKQLGYPATFINQGDVLPINAPPIREVKPGEPIELEVLSSHFSRRSREGVTLHWHYAGFDTLGTNHPELARGWAQIPFTQYRVEPAQFVRLTAPAQPMLCTFWVSAVTREGETVAANFVQHFVTEGPLPEREERGRTLVLRRHAHRWDDAHWSESLSAREEAEKKCRAAGRGHGYFEWEFRDEDLQRLSAARRLRVLCEASACRLDWPQTDTHVYSTSFELSLNDLPLHRALLPNHPHDARGGLSFLHDVHGGYGYLVNVALEEESLARVAELARAEGRVRFRCAVPETAAAKGGLTVYGYNAGRYPLCPTLVIEWEQDERRRA